MPNFLRRPRVRSLVAAGAMAGGLVISLAAPAHAAYSSPLYPTKAKCNAARPAYVTSYTSPGPCKAYIWQNGTVASWAFTVYTRN
ncbi:hypothetical protein [Polymorphospora rubra]|uniref:Uncharacterized protein n=1 Tax=Polymorphospora rubra TaxID=338584 RepID=A0A810MV07_9ACTN|nr:hypothetical protein [Polymorphospora rubra]BCJ63138.1 hypothetical protein Prubr_01590 [Polymorphospora rubra]